MAERTWCIVVPHQPRGARAARHRLAGELRGEVGAELLADGVAIVAELVGTTSGITYFINQQARYRNYQNVYAAIAIIGFIVIACASQ